VLEWLKTQSAGATATSDSAQASARQGVLWTSAPYQDEAPAIRTAAELAGAVEHLEFAVFRRYHNQLTRAERARLDNTIDNALFKAERYAKRLEGEDRARVEGELAGFREAIREGRERVERLRHQARRADLKLAQL